MRKINLDEYVSINLNTVTEPFHLNVNLYDIPNTVISTINTLPTLCKAINVIDSFPNYAKILIEKAASDRNITINWTLPYEYE